MKAEFDVKLEPKDLYAFNISQTYKSLHGWVSIFLAAVAIVMAVTSFGEVSIGYTILYIAMAIFVVAYVPISLWFQVKTRLKTNKVLGGTLHYIVTEDNIAVSFEDQKGELDWKSVYRLIANSKRILVFSSRRNAYVIPREQIGDSYDDFIAIAKSQLDKYRITVK